MENRPNAIYSLPLYEKTVEKPKLYRAYACVHLVLMLSFLVYRLLNPLDESYGVWILAFACELWFAFEWILQCNLRWLLVDYKSYPERLACRYSGESASKLPPVDIIITTADPFKEPAIVTANTVLSVLALDYPVQKFACYVSDDGASPITFYSLVETLRFAKKWVPFCRKFDIETRAPFVYFSEESPQHSKSFDTNFLQEWQEMKDGYEDLKRRIIKTLETKEVPLDSICLDGNDGFAHISSDIRNHSSVVKVIYENKGEKDDILPHVVYVASEKRPKVNHRYKAGAMNVMARVSGVMTNAPFILNLDCDMFVNNSKAIQHAMCFFLDCESERECGFVQFPQLFYRGIKDDPFGNQFKIFLSTMARGMNGIQGPVYCGTGCFHRRKALYGVPPATDQNNNKEIRIHAKVFHDLKASSWSFEAFRSVFGASSVLAASAQTIMIDTQYGIRSSPSSAIDEALNLSGCSYETNTAWGKEIGWMYGSTVEDVITGFKVHCLGWHSLFCIPEQPAFLGSAPANGPDSLVQQKRWATGLLEIFVSKFCPFLYIHRNITVRQRMMYAYFSLWGIWSVATFCYAILPAFCLLSGKSFLSGISKPAFAIAVALFLSSYGFTLWEFLRFGCSIREWWNNQRMWLIQCLSPWIFATFDVLMKLIGVSETVFVVTPKGSEDEDVVDFTFDSSSLFIPPTTVLFINLVAIVSGSACFMAGKYDSLRDNLFAEYLCSFWVVMNLWPFVKGLVRKGKRGIPWTTVIKSAVLAMFLSSTWIWGLI